MVMTPALLTAVDSVDHVHLVIGSNAIASARSARSREVGAVVKVVSEEPEVHYGLQKRIEAKEVELIQRPFQDSDLTSLGREAVDCVVDAVFVTLGRRHPLCAHVFNLCKRLRIPINVTDAPNLCTFTLLSTHTDGPLQIGITTSGKGCKLASRIRREVAASLPKNMGSSIERLGAMRRRIWEEDHASELLMDLDVEEDETGQSAAFNKLIIPDNAEAARARRMRWLAQICEYWPLSRLASITDDDVESVLRSFAASDRSGLDVSSLDSRRKRGRIVLAGSGPGNPDLLTRATHKAILAADLVLADKLVPAPVMDLIPRRADVYIARKFPGNADRAQEELLELGLAAVQQGKNVLRLKQGDPYLYGRGAEEYEFFRAHGYQAVVLPGITSALSAPLFAAIPATHRGVSDQVLICTGTGRKGAAPNPPAYLENQTVVFLMALHRLTALVESLTAKGKDWPGNVPCAVIERASCPDQRVIRTTLEYVCAAVEEEGSRPPGLLVVGHSCKVLWRGQERWTVEDGFRCLDDPDTSAAVAALEELSTAAMS